MDKGLVRYKEIISEIKKLGTAKCGRIIDCGCGNGILCHLLQKEGYENVTGYDNSSKPDYDVDFRFCDICRLEERANSVDVAILSEVLEHLTNEKLLLVAREIYRVLKVSSYMIITTPDSQADIDKTQEHIQLIDSEKLMTFFWPFIKVKSRTIYKNKNCKKSGSGNLLVVMRKA